MTKEEIIEFCEMKAELEPENEDIYETIINVLDKEPCEDCISREAVLDLAKKGVLISNGNYESVCKAINDLPSVTPKYTDEEIDRAQAVEQAYVKKMVELTVEELKRPKGKWISHREHCENLGAMPNGLGVYQWCSNCDCAIDIREWQRNHYNFCPNCGADMRESEDKV